MRSVTVGLLLAIAWLAVAQRAQAPMAGRDVDRATDQFRFKKDTEPVQPEKPLRSAALRDAVRDFTRGALELPQLHVTFAEFTTAAGQYFVALHLALPEGMTMAEGAKTTFFGVLEDSARRVRWSAEEPAVLQRSKSGQFHERSLVIEPRILNGVFGLAVDGKPVAMAALPMDLREFTGDTRRVSRLVLSNEVFVLDRPQQSTDPFCFGGVKVVPRADRTFRRSEEIWVFVEAQNPKVGDDGVPRFTTRIEAISGNPGEPKLLRTDAETSALPLRGVQHHYGVGTTLDISRLTPGEWKLRVSVTDALADERYELLESIRVVE